MNLSTANYKKWFSIGFGLRVTFVVVITSWGLWNWEAGMLYLADPMVLLLLVGQEYLPSWLFAVLTGGDPFYIPMNLLSSLLMGRHFYAFPAHQEPGVSVKAS